MALPVIGVTTTHGNNQYGFPIVLLLRAYVEALIQAGGAPILIPSDLNEAGWKSIFARLDGILFTGGGDVSPDRFHGEAHPKVDDVETDRDTIELSILKIAVDESRPFLGICRGIQLINVGLGGTLYTHIADQLPGALKHDYFPEYPRDFLAHDVKVDKGTHLAEILGVKALTVNSLHHQGIKTVAPGLKPVAYSPDGLVEALELPAHPFGLGVQWHPEWLTDQKPTRELFRAFIEAAGKRK